MDIVFKSKKLQKECSEQHEAVKKHGPQRAKLLMRRMGQLRAADDLSQIERVSPARCHELSGDKAGQLSVDLDHPYRLIFRPANDPKPTKEDGGLDWSKTTAIEILGIEDTHD